MYKNLWEKLGEVHQVQYLGYCTWSQFQNCNDGNGGPVYYGIIFGGGGGKENNVIMDDRTLFYHMEIMKKYMWS